MTDQNPYEAPEGELIRDDDEGVGEINFFSPSSRIGRLRYFAHGFLMTLIWYAMLIPSAILMSVSSTLGWIALAVSYIAGIVLFCIIMIQRLHDLNRSGWWLLLFLVPIANFGLAIYMMFWPGSDGSNNFGLHPPANKTWHWIVALVMPVMIIGILAAVAIPAYQDYVERAQSSEFQDFDPQ